MGSMASAIPLMALSGFAFAPAGAVLYMLIDELAPPGGATEASTWMITAVVAGVAAGTAVGGGLVSGGNASRGFAAAAGRRGAVMAGRLPGASRCFSRRPSPPEPSRNARSPPRIEMCSLVERQATT